MAPQKKKKKKEKKNKERVWGQTNILIQIWSKLDEKYEDYHGLNISKLFVSVPPF